MIDKAAPGQAMSSVPVYMKTNRMVVTVKDQDAHVSEKVKQMRGLSARVLNPSACSLSYHITVPHRPFDSYCVYLSPTNFTYGQLSETFDIASYRMKLTYGNEVAPTNTALNFHASHH